MTPSSLPRRMGCDRAVLVVVDIQERFRDLIHHMDRVLTNTERLIRFARILDIPIVVTEHYPKGLGGTVAEVTGLLGDDFAPIEKISFSCCGCEDFNTALAATGRDQIILCGIETHVCIYQTTADLRRAGRQVTVATDAVSSCGKKNRKLGLRAMAALGAQNLGAQMIMFELLERADDPRFGQVKGLLRE